MERKKKKIKEQTDARKAQLAAEEEKKRRRHVVLTKSQLEIQQKMVRNVELTEEEKALAKEVTEKRNRKKRKKKPTRLKRILNQERKVVFIAANGGVDPLALALATNSVSSKNSTDDDITTIDDDLVSSVQSNQGGRKLLQVDLFQKNIESKSQEMSSPPVAATADAATTSLLSTGENETVETKVETETTHVGEVPPPPSVPVDTDTTSAPLVPTGEGGGGGGGGGGGDGKKRLHVKYPRVPSKILVREYVEQNQSKELDLKITTMLKVLMDFQEKARKLDSTKARNSRRLLLGLREVRRSVKTGKAKAVIVATNIDESKTEGGLNDKISEILTFAKENDIPVLYSMTMRRLGKSVRKPKTSCVSVLSGDGAHSELKESIAMAKMLTSQWQNGVRSEPAAVAVVVEEEEEEVENERKTKETNDEQGKMKKKQKKKKEEKRMTKNNNPATASHVAADRNVATSPTVAVTQTTTGIKQLNPTAGEFTPSWER